MSVQQGGGSLSIIKVHKSYGRHSVLNDISFNVASGEFVTVLGPSGSGKSTLLRIIAGFSEASGGDVLIDGTSILQLPPHRRNVGLVFQNYALFPHMTVRENVGFALRMRKIPKDDLQRKVRATLELVQLSGFAERYPGQLSGGQQQRVALARTLIFEPRVLLLDEPMGALDKKLRELMGAELRRIHQELGITVFHVTHDQGEALSMSDRIVVLNNGMVAQIGSPEEIYNSPSDRFVAEFIGRSNFQQGVLDQIGANESIVKLHDGIRQKVAYAGNHRIGDVVTVLTRPENVSVLPVNEESSEAADAIVSGRTYIGDSVEFELTLPNGETIIAKLPMEEAAKFSRTGRNEKVRWLAKDGFIIDQ